MITYRGSCGSIPARSSAARIAIAPSSVAGSAASPPPSFPNGVRTALTITLRATRATLAQEARLGREAARGADFLPSSSVDFRKLLDVFLLDKALYEILYEMNSRPGWVRIPMLGILALPI